MIPIPMQEELPVFVTTVVGNVDYQEFRRLLERIDEILRSGTEFEFIGFYLKEWENQGKLEAARKKETWKAPSAKQQVLVQRHGVTALRCNILRILRGDDYRGFALYLAESQLAQWFCNVGRVDEINPPAKSTLHRYDKLVPEEVLRKIVDSLNKQASTSAAGKSEAQVLGLEKSVDIDAYFLDLTCVEANIHFPVDWVLLRDASRTLLGSIKVIRQHGLRHRMPKPEELLRQMNILSIEMTHQGRRKKNGRRERKRILRKMKPVLRTIEGHAVRYRDMLEKRWAETDLSKAEAQLIIDRLDVVLTQLPKAIEQAHERIIGGRQVKNNEKILSLYDPDLHVIVRGKAGAETEFGNTLRLGEISCGLIVDWKLYKEQAPADNNTLQPSLDHYSAVFNKAPASVATDRGLSSKANNTILEKNSIFNAICPKDPNVLTERAEEPMFLQLLRRRAQTEGRIGIFKNCFLGKPLRSKGFLHRNLAVTWSVLAHNLWVLARLPSAKEVAREKSEKTRKAPIRQRKAA